MKQKPKTKPKIKSKKLDFGFCNYSPFDIETMLPSGFVRLLPTSQDSKYVIDFVKEKTGETVSFNFYFTNYVNLVRQNVQIVDALEGGHVDILTTEKLSDLLGV